MGRQAKAKVIGTDSQLDLAVLKIDLPQLTPLRLANLRLGKSRSTGLLRSAIRLDWRRA